MHEAFERAWLQWGRVDKLDSPSTRVRRRPAEAMKWWSAMVVPCSWPASVGEFLPTGAADQAATELLTVARRTLPLPQ